MSNAQGSQGPKKVVGEVVELSSLRPHPRNYRGHPEAQLAHIVASLEQHGLYRNVVVANDGTILAGHGVVQAATKLGWKQIEVKRLELSPMSAAALKVLAADNELGRFAEDDDRALTELLKEIREVDPLALLGTGYDDAQLAALLMVTRPASEIEHADAAAEWVGMPEYQESEDQYQLIITFANEKDRSEYVRAKSIDIIKKQKMTWSARWPNTKREDAFSVRFRGQGSTTTNDGLEEVVEEERSSTPPAAVEDGAPSESEERFDPAGRETGEVDDPVLNRPLGWMHIEGGGVPGGHRVPWDGVRKPFIAPVAEWNKLELRRSDVVVDIGAYCGTNAIRAARHPVKEVRAYEPTPSTHALLSLTRLPNLRPVHAAVCGAPAPRSIALHVSPGIGVTNSIELTKNKAAVVEVPAVSYDDAVRGASVVKIDVEGAEYGFGSLVRPGIRAFVIDFHPLPGPKEEWIGKADAIISELENAGFRALVRPNWGNGWTRAGCWVRDLPDPGGECVEMTSGAACLGCGVSLVPRGAPAICRACASRWAKKARVGIVIGEPAQAPAVEQQSRRRRRPSAESTS